MTETVGIEKIGVDPCTLYLELPELCAARGYDAGHIRDNMMIDQRSLNPLYEDPVTMGVNAARTILTDEDRQRIELLIVASESGVDQEKSISSWIHRYLELSPHCRNFEIKHACYGGTAGLQMAVSWIASGLAGDAKALLITTDQSRMHLGQPWEYVLGAGAAAVLISRQPRIVRLELGKTGYWTMEVPDLTRPTLTVEVGHTETSLVSYIEALEEAYAHYVERARPELDFDAYFQKHVYHAPFGGMTYRAHRALLRHRGPMSKAEMWEHFKSRALSSLKHIRRMGTTYSSSTFIGLLGLLEDSPDLRPDDRISIFSYGSGCCAEFYSVRVMNEARDTARSARLGESLDGRTKVTVEQYEDLERRRTDLIEASDYETDTRTPAGHYDARYRGQHRLVLKGLEHYYRQYEWS